MAASNTVARERVVQVMRGMPEATERELEGDLDQLAALVQRRMRAKAPKFRSELANSIQVSTPQKLTREIGPSSAHGLVMETGVPAGGKGLPRFEDPEAADIKAWLQTHVFRGAARVSKGSAAAAARATELRDRYEGLAWHIRHHGVKAHPYAGPAFDELAPVLEVRMQAAAERAIAAAAAAGGAA